MTQTPSTMLPLGTPAPDFSLPDTQGRVVNRDDFSGARGLLVIFLCNHCPYVIHIRSLLAEFATACQAKGIAVVGINSNDADRYPADSPARMAEEIRNAGYRFPYLYDPDQTVARAYRAACTPDFFLFDHLQQLIYRGQFDSSRPGNGVPVSGDSLQAACDALLSGEPISPDQTPSMGCNIKWKPGNEPDYFG
ncbi:MAG: thioredoxin family protein [Gammaproteobacteria bacterium]|nr:thioredoxin family protein [Gammaproteobacteria bacterium]